MFQQVKKYLNFYSVCKDIFNSAPFGNR